MKLTTRLVAGLLLLPSAWAHAQEAGTAEGSETVEATPAAPAPAGPPPQEAPATPSAEAQPAAPAAEASTPPAPPATAPIPTLKQFTAQEASGTLSEGDVRQALELIKTNYVDQTAFSEENLSRATLRGLLDQLGSGAVIEEGAAVEEASPFRAEILDDSIGYVRLGTLSAVSLAELDAALDNFTTKELRSVILDFRATPPSSDYELAAEFIKRLAPKGKMLFAARRPGNKQELMFTSNQEPGFGGIVISVVNHQTTGAAEVIAASLREVSNGLVVGQTTAGEAAEFVRLPLHGGKQLRVAVGEISLPGDRKIFPDGLKPDLAVRVSPRAEAEVLKLGLEKGVGGLVFERERPRLNEAALVAGTNPELDDPEATQRVGRQTRGPYDSTLQRAVDLITTIQIFAGKNR